MNEKDLTAALLADLEGMECVACAACAAEVCGHAYVVNVALGYRDAPHCVDCLARRLGHPKDRFLRQVKEYVEYRDCYRAGWRRSSEREGVCALDRAVVANGAAAAPAAGPPGAHDAAWDAGDMACGDLVLELRTRLKALAPGQVLHVVSRDPGAPEDLPAWCRITGHGLVAARHPLYWIRRREEN